MKCLLIVFFFFVSNEITKLDIYITYPIDEVILVLFLETVVASLGDKGQLDREELNIKYEVGPSGWHKRDDGGGHSVGSGG